jgi:hypothetical protein
MPTGQLRTLIQGLRKSAILRDGEGLTDAELLSAFISRHDEVAFEVLVRRHGPMVLGVCRRLLGNVQDAEDPFQATFIVLVRKATSVVPREAESGGSRRHSGNLNGTGSGRRASKLPAIPARPLHFADALDAVAGYGFFLRRRAFFLGATPCGASAVFGSAGRSSLDESPSGSLADTPRTASSSSCAATCIGLT